MEKKELGKTNGFENTLVSVCPGCGEDDLELEDFNIDHVRSEGTMMMSFSCDCGQLFDVVFSMKVKSLILGN